MNAFQRQVSLRVLGIHLAVIVILWMSGVLKGCFRKKEKPEIVTFIEFGAPAPAVQPQAVERMPDPVQPEPAPEPEPEPEPEPAPVPEPTPIPEKPKKTIKPPKKVEQPKPKPKPKEPEKPKWKPTPVDEIKQSAKKYTPPEPAVTDQDIQKALQGIQTSKPTTTGPVGNPDAIAAYDAHIYKAFYNVWERPASPGSQPAKVTISISSTGRIISSSLSQSSGDAVFDASVMAAVRRVTALTKPPPPGYPLDNIIIQYRLID